MYAVRSRLVDLGASHLVVERIDAGRRYHCHCQIPLAGKSVYGRPFDAVEDDPLSAMEQVLSEVETWTLAPNSQLNIAQSLNDAARSETAAH